MTGGLRGPQVLRLLLALFSTFIVVGARAQDAAPERRARLVYVVAPDAQGCPSDAELRAAANARAGHELFGDPASLTLEVNIRRAGAAHVATVVLPPPDTRQYAVAVPVNATATIAVPKAIVAPR